MADKTRKVSVTLHTFEPNPNGNQREREIKYCGYNRQYAEMTYDDEGNGRVAFDGMTFPKVQADPECATAFSIGNPDGGDIIITGPVDPAVVCNVGNEPQLSAAVAVNAEHLNAMGFGKPVDPPAPVVEEAPAEEDGA